jgi:hypothetical protein
MCLSHIGQWRAVRREPDPDGAASLRLPITAICPGAAFAQAPLYGDALSSNTLPSNAGPSNTVPSCAAHAIWVTHNDALLHLYA